MTAEPFLFPENEDLKILLKDFDRISAEAGIGSFNTVIELPVLRISPEASFPLDSDN
ncbi:MAG: hypothetical protein ABSG49_06815 [Methanoregula sp.]|jgi:hypothetical protein|uniref:hypothetical protein n=1 Tax=Methanoregula sp. TaxID=2052170 RepID=UPI003C26CFD2